MTVEELRIVLEELPDYYRVRMVGSVGHEIFDRDIKEHAVQPERDFVLLVAEPR